MSVIGSNVLAGASGGAVAGYEISRSLRFNDADTAFLGRTPSSASSGSTKLTYSVWVKGANAADKTPILSASSAGGSESIEHRNNGTLVVFFDEHVDGAYTTSAVFRDPSAWYHYVFSIDTTLATAADRVKIYVNGVQVSTTASPALTQNFTFTGFNQQSRVQYIGRTANTSGGQHHYADAYYADIHMIDGQALAPTDFGEYDDNNVWQPKEYEGTYGTNGFHLDFSDNSSDAALGTDSSGNSNDWTVNNLVGDATYGGSATVWTSGDTNWVIASGGGSATMSAGGYWDVFSGLLQTDNVYAFTTSWTNGDTNGGWFFSDSNSTSLSGTHPNEGRGSNSIGQRGGTAALGTKGTFSSANSVTDGSSSISGFTDTNPAGSDSLTWVVDRNNHKVWVSHDAGSSWVKGGDPSNTSSTPSFYLPSTGDVYFGFNQNTQMTTPLTISALGGASTDSLIDTPTNYDDGTNVGGNYAVINPLDNPGVDPYGNQGATISNGNLDFAATGNFYAMRRGTMQVPSSGKWYMECTVNGSTPTPPTSSSQASGFGLCKSNIITDGNAPITDANTMWLGCSGYGLNFSTTRTDWASGAVDQGDVISLALDMDANTFEFKVNNSSVQTGTIGTTDPVHPFVFSSSTSYTNLSVNFGQRPFAYTPPTGHKSLCTTNLPDPTIADGSTAFDATLYTGTGNALNVTGLQFNPDLVWLKPRSVGGSNNLFDAVRGVEKYLLSDSTLEENGGSAGTGSLTSFNADGFSLGTASYINTLNTTYVGWTWDAGTTTGSNTDGTITSSVRANASAGFSIVSYTGNGHGQAVGSSTATVGHGLNAKPEFIIVKNLDDSQDWSVYHVGTDATAPENYYLSLNKTDSRGANSSSDKWSNIAPTSSVFTLGSSSSVNRGNDDHIAYCFAPVEGYSAFGSYTGGGSSYPFVYLGFKPAFVLIKNASTGGTNYDWSINDIARNPYNLGADNVDSKNTLFANLSDAEDKGSSDWQQIDFLSNGFRINDQSVTINASGSTFIYAAFAEHPFKTARAR